MFKSATIVAAALLAISGAASAATITYSSTTIGGDTWNRPIENGAGVPFSLSGVGTAVPYHVQPFFVAVTSVYDFISETFDPERGNPSLWDNYLVLYQGGFDAGIPLAGVVIGNDDFPNIGTSGFNLVPLTAGVQYYLVTTGFSNSDQGAFTNSITGRDGIELGIIPTPLPTGAGLAAAGLCIAGARPITRRRR